VPGVVADSSSAPKGGRVHQAQDLSEHLDATDKGALEKQTLRGDQAMLFDAGRDGGNEHVGWPGLGKEAEDASPVHSVNSDLQVGHASEHDAHNVGAEVAGPCQEGDSVHIGHAHVGHDHSVWAAVRQEDERLLGVTRRVELELAAKLAPDDG